VTQKSTRSGRAKNGSKPSTARGARPTIPAGAPPKRRRGRPTRHGRPTRQETKQREAEYARFEGERVIHRYGNRRFYDLEGRRAVTLEEIAELVRKGENVRVLDVEAQNEDITRRVLTQIILEEKSQSNLEMLPVEFLRKLIATQDEKVATWLDTYLKTGVELIDRSLREGFPLVTNFQRQMADLLRATFPPGMINSYRELKKETERARETDRASEIEELRRRLDELAKQK
jgi:polyhydroxyalkanoate synthesis repressor PhaR